MLQKGIKELYIDELKDLYSAENQLVKALPKMAKAAHLPSSGREIHSVVSPCFPSLKLR